MVIHNESTKLSTRQIGKLAEDCVCSYLTRNGLRLLDSNFRCKTGEIDLIMRDHDYYVFVEVRYRKHDDFGGGCVTVTRPKQRKLIRTANYFLLQYNLYNKVPCRFDVVGIGPMLDESTIDWIRDAFWVQ